MRLRFVGSTFIVNISVRILVYLIRGNVTVQLTYLQFDLH